MPMQKHIGYTADPSQRCAWCGDPCDQYVIYDRQAICERCVREDEESSKPENVAGAVALVFLIAVASVLAWIVKG